MRRSKLILCDSCKDFLGDITSYGMKTLPRGMKFTGLFCPKCEKDKKSKKVSRRGAILESYNPEVLQS